MKGRTTKENKISLGRIPAGYSKSPMVFLAFLLASPLAPRKYVKFTNSSNTRVRAKKTARRTREKKIV